MALEVKYCELLSDPLSSVIQNYAATNTTVVAGLGVSIDSSGTLVVAASITTLLGIALNTPAAAGDMVSVLRKGKLRIKDNGSNGYINAGVIPAVVGAPVYQVPATGHWSNTTTSNRLVGYITKVVSSGATTAEFEAEINVETNAGQPST